MGPPVKLVALRPCGLCRFRRLPPITLRPDCQRADSPLSVSDMVDHLYAPEAAFFGTSDSTGFRFSRSQDRGHLLSGTNKIGATYFLAPRNRGWPLSFRTT